MRSMLWPDMILVISSALATAVRGACHLRKLLDFIYVQMSITVALGANLLTSLLPT